MKKVILNLFFLPLFMGSAFVVCEQKDADTVFIAQREGERIVLPNGVSVSKKRFKSIYFGLKEIFAEEAHRADDVYNLAFIKTLVIDKTSSVFGWDRARIIKLSYKHILFDIACSCRNSGKDFLVIDNVYDFFTKHVQEFYFKKFDHPIIREIVFDSDIAADVGYFPHIGDYLGDWSLVNALKKYDVIRDIEGLPAGSCFDKESLAILRAIIGRKAFGENFFPYLKKLEELPFYQHNTTH